MNKQLLSLLVIISALGAAIYFLTIRAGDGNGEKSKLFPELAAQAQKIQQISVTRANGAIFKASQSAHGWVTTLGTGDIEYPMAQEALAELVDGLSKAILFEAKTAKSENFQRLGLQDLDKPDSLATLVELRVGTKQYQVLVGSQASLGQGTYVRLKGHNQTWLLDRTITMPSDQNDWLKQPILDISLEEVSYVRREGRDGFEIIHDVQQDDGFQLVGINDNQTLKYERILSGFVDNLTKLKFAQIAAPETANFDPSFVTAVYEVGLTNGRIISMWLWENEETTYARFEGDSEKYWYNLNYELSSFSAGQITKNQGDFIQDKNKQIQLPQEFPIDEGESPQ